MVVLNGPGRDKDKLYGIFCHTGSLSPLPECETKKLLAIFTEESMRGRNKKPVAASHSVKGSAYLFSAGLAGNTPCNGRV